MAISGLIQKLAIIRDRDVDRQFDNFVDAFTRFPYLGELSSDPSTTGWGAGEICWWIDISTPTAIVIKFWNGAAIRTITST